MKTPRRQDAKTQNASSSPLMGKPAELMDRGCGGGEGPAAAANPRDRFLWPRNLPRTCAQWVAQATRLFRRATGPAEGCGGRMAMRRPMAGSLRVPIPSDGSPLGTGESAVLPDLSGANHASTGRWLAIRAITRRATADLGDAQRGAAAGAVIAFLPAMEEEPGTGRIGEILANDAHGFAADPANRAVKSIHRGRFNPAGLGCGRQPRAPQYFIDHPIAEAGEAVLIKQHRFDRRLAVPAEKVPHSFQGELPAQQARRKVAPPGRRF